MKHIAHSLLLMLALLIAPLYAEAQSVNYHTVETGQTVYSIARDYGVSPKDILKLNPKAEEVLHPGDKLVLPAGAKLGTAGIAGSNCKEMYEVQKKDNLYRIALNHNLKVDELLAANPGLTEDSKLKKGSFLCIPYSKAEMAARKAAAEKAAAEKAAAERKAYLSVPHPMKSLRAAVILPFKDGDNRAQRMLEFYRGLLLAVDSIKTEGINVEVYAYHSGTTIADINAVIAKDEMKTMNVIFGPLDEVQAKPLNDFCRANKIRLVMPFATTGMIGVENPLTYIVTDDQDNVQDRAAQSVRSQIGVANYVVVNAANSDERGRQYVARMVRALQGSGSTIHNVQLDGSAADFAAAFDASKQNVVIMNSIRETNLKKLDALLDAYVATNKGVRISMLGYPDWLTFKDETLGGMFRYDSYVYSTFFRNNSLPAVKSVEANYQSKFGKAMGTSTPRFGLLGFDVGYYFLHGISACGESFENLQNTLPFKPLQHKLSFERIGENKGFVNRNVYLVRFKTNKKIELR